jgi:hypothetical protein
MTIITNILCLLTIWISFNTWWFIIIRNRTGYPGNTQGDLDMGIITILIFIFGPFMFLFFKQIKLYRKHLYLKNRISFYKMMGKSFISHPILNIVSNPEIEKLERIYKISKMHQITKRNNLKKKLLLK